MGDAAHDAELQALLLAGDAGQEGSLVVIRERAAQGIAHVVAEHGDARHLVSVGLHGQLLLRVGARRSAPPLSIDEDGGVYLSHLPLDEVHGLYVMHAHQVHAEAVNMVLFHPVTHALQHELPHERLLGSRLVAAARTVAWGSIGVIAIVIARIGLLEIAALQVESVIVNHVQYYPYARLVQGLHHLLELLDAGGGHIGICGIAAIRHVVVHGVISPVVLRRVQARLVYRGVIEGRQDMHGVHAQVTEMLDGPRLGERQELARILGITAHGEVTMVHLVDDQVRGRGQGGSLVGLPSLGVCLVHVYHHAALAIHAHGLGEDPGALSLAHVKGIVGSLQVTFYGGRPLVFARALHLHRLVGLGGIAILVESHHHLAGGGGSVELERGLPLGIIHLTEHVLRLGRSSHHHRSHD